MIPQLSLYALVGLALPPAPRGVDVRVSDPRGVLQMQALWDAGVTNVSAIARQVQHDPRTVAKALGLTCRRGSHGGGRRDNLGDQGRMLLDRLTVLFPRAGDKWYARCLSKCLDSRIKKGVVRLARKHLRLSRKGMTVLYSEGVTDLVIVEQAAFMRFYQDKVSDDASFHDRTFFIDVTSFNQQELARTTKAVGQLGMPVVGHAPSDRGKNWDFIGGINRVSGLVAPWIYEGHVDGDVIIAYFENVLLPECPPGSWIVLDGASYWSCVRLCHPMEPSFPPPSSLPL